MKSQLIQAPRRALEERRRDLLRRWRDLQHHEQELLEERRADWEDTSAEQRDAALIEVLGERDLRELRALEGALGRLERGTYGLCEQCGEGIEARRLELIPETSLCLGCASLEEARRSPLGIRS